MRDVLNKTLRVVGLMFIFIILLNSILSIDLFSMESQIAYLSFTVVYFFISMLLNKGTKNREKKDNDISETH